MDDHKSISPDELRNLKETETELKSNGDLHVEEDLVSSEGMESSSTSVNKRHGLRKWRRIPRELVVKPGSNSNRIEIRDLSVSPVSNTMVNVNGGSPIRSVFPTRSDSDHSIMSSSAANDPRTRHEISSLNGRNSVVVTDDQQRNGRIEPGKKARGFKIEKEKLNHTMGADSRNSNFVFVQGTNTVASKGEQTGMFMKYDEEYSDYADKDLNEEEKTKFIKSDVESDDVSQEDVAAENSWEVKDKNNGERDDALVESIRGLHFAQEEFEKEVQKWKAVGKDDPFIFGDPMHELLELKDAKILELEDSMTELEDQLKNIIQAEVEYVAIKTTTESLTAQIKHNLQQKNLSSQKLETREDVKKLQNSVCRFTSYFMIQLILLFVILYLKFLPQNVEVVPT